MSAWVTREAMRGSLRVLGLGSPWKPRSVSMRTLVKDAALPGQQLAPARGPTQIRTWLTRGHLGPARFYTQGRFPSEELEERENLSSLPAEPQPDDGAPGQGQRTSPFYEHLKCCASPSDVLDLTGRYAPTTRQVSNSFTHMWATTKKMSDDQRRYELKLMFEHPALEKLLQRAARVVGRMRCEDMAYSLLSIVNLGVPQRSRVVQTYLRTCQERLNDFDEKGLSILASCLEHMESSPNADALKHGIRLIAESRLPRIKNVMALQTMMRLLGKDAPLELKHKLERKALSMADQFTLPNTQYMISTMAAMEFNSKPLFDICSKKITENIHGIPFWRLLTVLQSCRKLHYRDLSLLTAVSDHVASADIWTNKQVTLFLAAFESLSFCPGALMEAFAEKVIANADALTLKDLLCVLKVYSALNYDLQHTRQQFLDSLSQALDSYLPKMSGYELLKSVYCLCLMGHFPPALLEKLLQAGTPEMQITAVPKVALEKMFQTVHLCLHLDRPVLPGPLTVPTSALGEPISNTPPVNQRLSRALRSAFSGQEEGEALQEMVVVENFYLIDGMITRASGPAGEGCSPAESSDRIAVLCPPPSSFCYGTSNPRGPLAIKIRHLRLMGYKPVLVTEQELKSVPEEKVADFLRERLFPECHAADMEQLGS